MPHLRLLGWWEAGATGPSRPLPLLSAQLSSFQAQGSGLFLGPKETIVKRSQRRELGRTTV